MTERGYVNSIVLTYNRRNDNYKVKNVPSLFEVVMPHWNQFHNSLKKKDSYKNEIGNLCDRANMQRCESRLNNTKSGYKTILLKGF